MRRGVMGIMSVRATTGGANARRRRTALPLPTIYPPGSWTFTAPSSDVYEFAGWSPGYASLNSAPSVSGSFALKKVHLAKGQTVAIVVGAAAALAGSGSIGANTATSVTFPDGSVMTVALGDPASSTAAAATGGDVNLPGNVSSDSTVGAAAPSYGDYNGGPQSSTAGVANAPGGGAPYRAAGATGGDGLVIVRRVYE
jgi:hypothetical protein